MKTQQKSNNATPGLPGLPSAAADRSPSNAIQPVPLADQTKRRPGKRRWTGITSMMAAAALSGAGCASPRTATFSPQMTAPEPVALCPGDNLKVSYPGLPELDQIQKIRVDGTVSLPMIGEVVAGGKSLQTFQGELVARYKPQLQNSDVVVTLESGGISVFISGAVKYPGKLVLGRPTTVIQGLMEAGGPNEFADIRKVHLLRMANGRQHTQLFNLQPTMRGEVTSAFYLKDGDMIHVPQSFF